MKAERRHELKTNKLATTLVTIPGTSRKFAGRLILACAAVAVIAFFIVNKWTQSVAEKEAWHQDLASAQQDLNQLEQPRNLDPNSQHYLGWNFDPHEIRDTCRLTREKLQAITNKSSDPQLLAQAWELRGDLDWRLANVYYLDNGQPAFAGAESDPAMRPDMDRSSLLKDAAEAYHQVIEHYPDQSFAVISAQFGLAAVAEDEAAATHNGDNWLQAQQLYQSIINNAKAMGAIKQQAQYRLNLLPQLARPVLIAQAPPPATTQSSFIFPGMEPSATTGPSTPRSATGPTTSSDVPRELNERLKTENLSTPILISPTTQPVIDAFERGAKSDSTSISNSPTTQPASRP